jgi:flagellar biogenesis protein FliO
LIILSLDGARTLAPEISSSPARPSGNSKFMWLFLFGVVVLVGGVAGPQLLVPQPSGKANPSSQSSSTSESKAFAKLTETPAVSPKPESPDLTASFTRLFVGAGVVLTLCVFTIWLGRRWMMPKPMPEYTGFQWIDHLQIGPQLTVYLIRVGDQHILAGADAGGIRTMTPLPDDPGLDEQSSTPEGTRPDERSGIRLGQTR